MNEFLTPGVIAFLLAPFVVALLTLGVVTVGFRSVLRLLALRDAKQDDQHAEVSKRITEIKEGLIVLLDRNPRPN